MIRQPHAAAGFRRQLHLDGPLLAQGVLDAEGADRDAARPTRRLQRDLHLDRVQGRRGRGDDVQVRVGRGDLVRQVVGRQHLDLGQGRQP